MAMSHHLRILLHIMLTIGLEGLRTQEVSVNCHKCSHPMILCHLNSTRAWYESKSLNTRSKFSGLEAVKGGYPVETACKLWTESRILHVKVRYIKQIMEYCTHFVYHEVTKQLKCVLTCKSERSLKGFFVWERFVRNTTLRIQTRAKYVCRQTEVLIMNFINASLVFDAVEEIALEWARTLSVGFSLTVNTQSFSCYLVNMNTAVRHEVNYLYTENGSSSFLNHVRLNITNVEYVIDNSVENLPVSIFAFKRSSLKYEKKVIFSSECSLIESLPAGSFLNSDIVIVSCLNACWKTLTDPVDLVLVHWKPIEIPLRSECVFWDKFSCSWSERGCRVLSVNVTHTHCACWHLTSFSLLISGGQKDPDESEARSILTYVGIGLSSFCLILCYCTFKFYNNLNQTRTILHRNLSICLLLGNIFFAIGIKQTQERILCLFFAYTIHWMFLSAFMWMFLEGVNIFIVLKNIKKSNVFTRPWAMYTIGYLLAKVICVVTLSISRDNYALQNNCWLSILTIWTFKGPMYCIIVINMFIFFYSLFLMFKHTFHSTRHSSRIKMVFTWIRGSAVIISVLGITWIFEEFSVNESTDFFSYLFVIFNAFQGFLFFLLYCPMDSKVRREYKRSLRQSRWLPKCIQNRMAPSGARTKESEEEENSLGEEFQKILYGVTMEDTVEESEKGVIDAFVYVFSVLGSMFSFSHQKEQETVKQDKKWLTKFLILPLQKVTGAQDDSSSSDLADSEKDDAALPPPQSLVNPPEHAIATKMDATPVATDIHEANGLTAVVDINDDPSVAKKVHRKKVKSCCRCCRKWHKRKKRRKRETQEEDTTLNIIKEQRDIASSFQERRMDLQEVESPKNGVGADYIEYENDDNVSVGEIHLAELEANAGKEGNILFTFLPFLAQGQIAQPGSHISAPTDIDEENYDEQEPKPSLHEKVTHFFFGHREKNAIEKEAIGEFRSEKKSTSSDLSLDNKSETIT